MPGDPSLAFLERRGEAKPYFVAVLGSSLLMATMIAGVSLRRTRKETDAATGRQIVRPARSLRRRFIEGSVLLAIVVAVGGALAAHAVTYLWDAGLATWVVLALLPLSPVLVIALTVMLRAAMIATAVDDVVVNIDPLRRGKSTAIRVRQEVANRNAVKSVTVCLRCERFIRRRRHSGWAPEHQQCRVFPSSRLSTRSGGRTMVEVEAKFSVPPAVPASGTTREHVVRWLVVVTTTLHGRPAYEAAMEVYLLE